MIILACAAGLCVVGTIDDRAHLGPGVRVLAEFAAAFALWQSDLGWLLWDGNLLDLALTTLWVVGLVNAFNLMDNLDGAAATVGGGLRARAWALLAGTQGDDGDRRDGVRARRSVRGLPALQPRTPVAESSSATAAACRSASWWPQA